MPTKHIDEHTWRKVEKKTIEAIIKTKEHIKETDMLKWLILKGLEELEEEDYRKNKKKQ